MCDGVQNDEGGEDTRVRTGAVIERAPPVRWAAVATGTGQGPVPAAIVLGRVCRNLHSYPPQGGGQGHALSKARRKWLERERERERDSCLNVLKRVVSFD